MLGFNIAIFILFVIQFINPRIKFSTLY